MCRARRPCGSLFGLFRAGEMGQSRDKRPCHIPALLAGQRRFPAENTHRRCRMPPNRRAQRRGSRSCILGSRDPSTSPGHWGKLHPALESTSRQYRCSLGHISPSTRLGPACSPACMKARKIAFKTRLTLGPLVNVNEHNRSRPFMTTGTAKGAGGGGGSCIAALTRRHLCTHRHGS